MSWKTILIMILKCFMNGKKIGYYSSIHRKQKLYFFSLKNVEKFPELFFGDCTLEYVSQHKHLGVLLSSNLGWSDHIDNIVKKAYKKIGLLKNLNLLFPEIF